MVNMFWRSEWNDCVVQVAVCTPGRMIDLIKMKACNMLRVTYLVFDEADRMFDMGFEPQVSESRSRCNAHGCIASTPCQYPAEVPDLCSKHAIPCSV